MHNGRRYWNAAGVCFLIAAAAAFLSLMGWVLDDPDLRGFGFAEYPDWPLAAIANFLLAIALLAHGQAWRRLRLILLAIPALIACGAIVEYLAATSIGFDQLLFRQELTGVSLPTPGRPGVMATLSIIAVTVMAWRMGDGPRRTSEALLACAILGLAAMSIVLLVLGSELASQHTRVAASCPASLAAAFQALGILLSAGRIDPGLRWTGRSQVRLARFGFAGVIILPAILLPIEIRLSQHTTLGPITTEILASAFNLMIVVGLLGWAVERITEEQARLEQTSQELRDSEERLLLAIEAHEISLFAWDVASGAIAWSPGAETQLGVPMEALRSYDRWSRLIDPEDLAALEQLLTQVAEHRQQRMTFGYHLRRPGGEVRTIEGSARCFYDEAGQLVRTVGVAIDVTEAERREAALVAGRAQLQSILETVPDAMIVVDETGIIQSFSTAAEKLFGYAPSAIVGRGITLLLPAWEGPGNGDDALLSSRGRTLIARRSDGTELPAEVSIGEAWINKRRILTAFVRDISERVAAEEHLEQLNAEFAHSARLSAMGEMASALAHELNQPLAAAANFLGAIEQSLGANGGDPNLVPPLEEAQSQLLRAGDIIRRLRDFIRNHDVERHVEDIGKIIDDACALAFVGHADAEVARQVSDDARTIIGDRVQIQQVFVNILRNAAQAMRNGTERPARITIRVDRSGTDAAVTVSDEGPGFPRRILDQPYQPFFSTKRGDNMGVGLSISRRIIGAHGGRFSIGNTPTGGGVVHFTIPLFVRPQEEEL